MNITTKQVLSAGYVTFPSPKGAYCTGGFQKSIQDASGHLYLYFINLYHWMFPDEHEGWSVEVRLYQPGGTEFDVNLLIGNETLAEVEAFYAKVYVQLGCCSDVHNNY